MDTKEAEKSDELLNAFKNTEIIVKLANNLIGDNISKNIITSIHVSCQAIQHCQLIIFTTKIFLSTFSIL